MHATLGSSALVNNTKRRSMENELPEYNFGAPQYDDEIGLDYIPPIDNRPSITNRHPDVSKWI